jgi:hypothetical protein
MTPLVEEKLVSYPRYTMTKWGFPKGQLKKRTSIHLLFFSCGRGSTLAPKERVSQLGKSLTDAL